MRAITHTAPLTGLVISVAAIPAQGTFMDVVLDPESDYAPFVLREVLSIHINYPQNGNLSEFLDGRHQDLVVEAGLEDVGVQQLMDGLNNKIRSDGSRASVEDLAIKYHFYMVGGNGTTTVEFAAVLVGNITGYAISADRGRMLVDLGWRGLGLNESVSVGGFDISFPLKVLRDREPVIYDLVQGEAFRDYRPQRGGPHDLASDAEANISLQLIDSDTVLDQPMWNWSRDLFPEPLTKWGGTVPLPSDMRAKAVGHPATIWSIGTHSYIHTPRLAVVHWSLAVANGTHPAISGNISYEIRTHQHLDSVVIAVIGIAKLDVLDGVEVAVVDAREPKISFMVAIYVATGLAATGAGLFVVFRSRAQKNRKG